MRKKGKAIIIVGGQWGDEGKGLISAYIAKRDDAKLVIRAGVGPNAEHGIYIGEDQSTYIKVNQLPLGWMFNPESQIRIGSGVAVNPEWLLAEMKRYGISKDRIKVDYRCPIITKEHIEMERKSKHLTKNVGSTLSGSGFCRADYILRRAPQAREIKELEGLVTDVISEVNEVAEKNVVVIESSQGTFLSLGISDDYGFHSCTSDNVVASSALDDVVLNWQKLDQVVMAIKAIPSREGTGSFGKSRELSITEIEEKGLMESSSIGGAVRRKADSIDWDLLQYAAEINGATQIALTFLDHYDPVVTNLKDRSKLTSKVKKLIKQVEAKTGVEVTVLNTGKRYDNIIDLTRETASLASEEKRLRSYVK